MEIDRRMMRRALALASLGKGTTSPNPLVGAVVSKGATVVGQGFHARAGEPHAEVIALAEAGKGARGATLYTNLEPCCHTGRTPPCVEAILCSGVSRVVAAMQDPDPRVNGEGFRTLRGRGIAVAVGVLEPEAVDLNRAFAKLVRRRLPWVTLKAAGSLDGRIATRTGDSKWITSDEAREHARLLRREHDAIMVGIGTVLADDPRLTAEERKTPLIRVVMDTHLRLPPGANLVRARGQGPVVVFCGPAAPRRREAALRRRGIEVERLSLRRGRPELKSVLAHLAARGVTRVLVEGGGELHAAFIEQRLADRMIVYIAPRVIGGRRARPMVGGEGARLMSDVGRLGWTRYYRVGDEIVVEGEWTETGSR